MFWYLATPYSKYPGGLDAAFQAAAEQAALFVRAGVPVFCPIAHAHPIAEFGWIDHHNLEAWLKFNKPFISAALGLVVCKLPTWDESLGIYEEIAAFENARKLIVYMEPWQVPEAVLEHASGRSA